MIDPINIYSKETPLYLSMGIYNVYVIGGWYVDLGKFNFRLKKTNIDKIIEPQKVTWKAQSYFKSIRTKKVFSFVIDKGGEFIVEFENQDTLIVKKSNLIFRYLFEKKNDPKSINLIFERN